MSKYLLLLATVWVAVLPVDSFQPYRPKSEEEFQACDACRETMTFFNAMQPKERASVYKPRVLSYCAGDTPLGPFCPIVSDVVFNFMANTKDYCTLAEVCPRYETGEMRESLFEGHISCELCDYTAMALQREVRNEDFVDMVKQYINDGLCKALDSDDDVTECLRVVRRNIDLLIGAIKRMNVSRMCRVAGCRETAPVSSATLRSVGLSGPKQEQNRMTPKRRLQAIVAIRETVCESCSSIVNLMKYHLDGEVMQQHVDSVKMISRDVCKSIPFKAAAHLCQTMIAVLGDSLVEAIQEIQQPDEVCAEFYFCSRR